MDFYIKNQNNNNMLVHYDKEGNLEYGFILGELTNNLKKFVNFKQKDTKMQTVVIPELRGQDARESYYGIKSCVVMKRGCFSGIKDLTVIVPSDNANAIIDLDAFDKGTNVHFVMPFKASAYLMENEAFTFPEIVLATPETIKNRYVPDFCLFYGIDRLNSFSYYRTKTGGSTFNSFSIEDYLKKNNVQKEETIDY